MYCSTIFIEMQAKISTQRKRVLTIFRLFTFFVLETLPHARETPPFPLQTRAQYGIIDETIIILLKELTNPCPRFMSMSCKTA